MTPVLYFLHLKTLDILLLIGNISVADDGFSKIYIYLIMYLIYLIINVIRRLNLT